MKNVKEGLFIFSFLIIALFYGAYLASDFVKKISSREYKTIYVTDRKDGKAALKDQNGSSKKAEDVAVILPEIMIGKNSKSIYLTDENGRVEASIAITELKNKEINTENDNEIIPSELKSILGAIVIFMVGAVLKPTLDHLGLKIRDHLCNTDKKEKANS